MDKEVARRVRRHVDRLTSLAPYRPPGSPANRRATDYVQSVLAEAGVRVAALPFRATHWQPGRARLHVDGAVIEITPPPFAARADAQGRAVEAETAEQLGALGADARSVVILRGDLAAPYFPKAFPFVALDDQQAVLAALEKARPAAVIAVVADDARHEPVFEDPDLAFPYATVSTSEGVALRSGSTVRLEIESTLSVGEGVNVSAGTMAGHRRLVCAHIDSKATTPGALDNGGGVAVLLALAEGGLDGLGAVELVFFNGEDHYAAPGEQAWLAANAIEDIDLAINVDGAGLRGYGAAASAIGADARLDAALAHALASVSAVRPGPPWFESDHVVFAMRGIPTVAITTDGPFDLLKRLSHASDDQPDRIDEQQLADVVEVLRSLLKNREEVGTKV